MTSIPRYYRLHSVVIRAQDDSRKSLPRLWRCSAVLEGEYMLDGEALLGGRMISAYSAFLRHSQTKEISIMEQLAAYFYRYENPPSKFTMMPLKIDLLP